jgi:TRAP-type uncharacterized transport system substrate-binding protein
MDTRLKERPRFRGRGVAILGFIAFGVGLLAVARAYHVASMAHVKVSPGNREDLRYELVQALARESEAHSLHIDLVETDGSEDAIEQIDAGRLDFAFVFGGIDFQRHVNLRQVAALNMAPVHLLVKEEYFEAVSKNLSALRGKSINLGSGTGTLTYWLARELLTFAGLKAGDRAGGDYKITGYSLTQMEREADRARMPDAIFFTGTLPEPSIRGVVLAHRYRLVPLEFREAFALEAITAPRGGSAESAAARVIIQKERVYETRIPAFTYQISPPVPPTPIQTLGVRVLLVTHRKTSSVVVSKILDAVYTTRFARVLTPPLQPKMEEQSAEMPWHPGALRFFERNDPLITGELLSRSGEVVSIAGPVLGGLFCIWQWFHQRSRFRREQSFKMYIKKVNALENRVMELGRLPHQGLDQLLELQHELSLIKTEALNRFARGEMDGAELMAGFLVHINDVRSQLNGMIDAVREERLRHESHRRQARLSPATDRGSDETHSS